MKAIVCFLFGVPRGSVPYVRGDEPPNYESKNCLTGGQRASAITPRAIWVARVALALTLHHPNPFPVTDTIPRTASRPYLHPADLPHIA